MDVKYESSPAAIAELALGGVVLERREMMVGYALECLRLGLTEWEIRPALVDYIKAKNWPWQELDARMGMVEVAKARYRKERPDLFAAVEDEPGELQVVSLGDVAPEEVRWLWPDTIPVGKVTVVYGEPGIGKTSWVLDLAARVSAGISWPAPRWRKMLPPLPPPQAGKVLLLNGEDHVGNSIRPRLCRGEANLPNVVSIKVPKSTASGGPRAFDLGRDTSMLKKQIETQGNVRLVIIDPLEAYTGAGPRSQKMRALLSSLEALAEECGVAVVVISACQKCELPVKYVWRVDGEITNPDLRWMVPVRCDGSEVATALAFKFSQGGLNWDQQDYTFHEDQLQGCSAKVQRQQPQREVASWLKKFLGRDIPHLVVDVLAEGARQGFSASRVQRARVALNAVSYKDKEPHGQWFWEITDRPIPLNLRDPAVTSSESRSDLKRQAEVSKPRKAKSGPVAQDVFVVTDWDLVPKKPMPTAEEWKARKSQDSSAGGR